MSHGVEHLSVLADVHIMPLLEDRALRPLNLLSHSAISVVNTDKVTRVLGSYNLLPIRSMKLAMDGQVLLAQNML